MRRVLLALLAFALAGALAAVAARTLAREVEARSVAAVEARLRRDGHDWASVVGDGLRVVLEGTAPSEAERFRAMSSAGGVVDASRVIDGLRVADSAPVRAPDFAIEILRNDAGVSLIGLVPEGTDRARLNDEIAQAASGQAVSDLLETAAYQAPPGWEPALGLALDALEVLPRSKVSVSPGRVVVDAVAESPAEARRLERAVRARVPEGVALVLSVAAPRPVIAPFTLRFVMDGGPPRFDACSADTEAARDAILAAAAAAGAEGGQECRLGLGAPSPQWGEAAATAIAGLAGMGGGTLTMTDADVLLQAPPGTEPGLFDRVAGEVEGAMPPGFSVRAENPALPTRAPPQGPPAFTATLSEEGAVRLAGRLPDAQAAGIARTFAEARFGGGEVTVATRVAPEGLPPGWPVRVLAGLDALAKLAYGQVTVTPDLIRVSGATGSQTARDDIAREAIATLGAGAAVEIEVTYDQRLDPVAALPTPEECVAQIAGVTAESKITFEPGSATLSPEAGPVVGAVAGILRACGDLRLRIAGYTDSQGGEEGNLALSQARADAVLAALRAERVPVAGFEAVGYGEADPIADNGTEAGREANRRIEFALLGGLGQPPGAPPGPAMAAPIPEAPSLAPPARPAAAAGGEASAEEAQQGTP